MAGECQISAGVWTYSADVVPAIEDDRWQQNDEEEGREMLRDLLHIDLAVHELHHESADHADNRG